MNLQRLVERVRQVPLFSALGAEIVGFTGGRIHSWEEWQGPEEPLVENIGTRLQFLHDSLVAKSEEEKWNQALLLVVKLASQNVPYVESEDVWYGPNAAAWSAAWAFSLEEAYLSRNLPLPAELRAQLQWYEKGHWPCALLNLSRTENIEDYVIY